MLLVRIRRPGGLMSCGHSPSSRRVALHEGLCPRCLHAALEEVLAVLESPEQRRTELAAYLYGYRCPPQKALANADTIARAKELVKCAPSST